MREQLLARRYSKALLDLGQEEKCLEQFREEMGRLTCAFKAEPQMLKVLSLREFSLEKKKRVAESLGKMLHLSPWMQTFLEMLVKRGRIQFFSAIASVFEKLVRETENRVIAKVSAADKKSVEGVKDSLKQALEKLTGKKVEFEIEEKPSLIGGLQISVGDTIYDASLIGELERIKEKWM